MAQSIITIYVYDKIGNTLLFTKNIAYEMITVGELLETQEFVSNNITEISNTVGGQPLDHNDNPGYFNYYDVTPQAKKITKILHNGEEYEFGLDGTYEGTIQDYSAMQGPAPSGFHVPSKDEWAALCGILTTTFSMESKHTTMGTYLKMPMAGRRYNNTSNVSNVGSYGVYWSSTPYDASNAYRLIFGLSSITPLDNSYSYRSFGLSVRCFKDTPVIPTASWTTLYDGSSVATGAGVFYNATDGLISVSGNGQTWYTIQDKNLGATTVFNQGDTLTDANCGYFYQWGNNYGFAHNGTITTSSTKVDASTYGPGNYYSSSTFITVSESPYDWSSVQKDNIWGGVTGTQPIIISGNLVLGDKLYKIVTSATAPSSGTASNVITIVTD